MEFSSKDMEATDIRLAGVEGGGTGWKAVITDGSGHNIIDFKEFPTHSSPEDTLRPIREWLSERSYHAIGVASFGPIDPKESSPTYGFITSTPKPGWRNTDVLTLLNIKNSNIPYAFDTDVNAPALSESMSCEDGTTSVAYITIGTGVGVGVVVNCNYSLKGLLHPEAGHIQVKLHPKDTFAGSCPFHGACIEGLISSGALAGRANVARSELPNLPDDHEVWEFFSYYLAQLCATLVLLTSVEKIVIGGGIMNRGSLFPRVRAKLLEILNEYIQHEKLTPERVHELVVAPKHGAKAGIIGAAYLAKKAYENHVKTA